MPKNRIVYLDFIKTIAILFVITLHNGTLRTNFIDLGTLSSTIQYGVRLFCEGVPFFILINGFLSFPRTFDAKKHLRKTATILLLVVIWSVILDVFFTLMNGKTLTFTGVLVTVLKTSLSQPNTGVLWFLQKLFVLYLVYPILKHLYDTKESLFNYTLLVLLISTYGVSLLSLASGIWDNEILQGARFFLNQYSLVIGSNIYVVYFMMGGYLHRHMDALPKKVLFPAGALCIIAACGVGIFASYHKGATYPADFNFSQIFLLIAVVSAFVACSHIPFRNRFVNGALALIGDNTMGIYLLHMPVIAVLKRVLPLSYDALPARVGISLLVFAVSLGLTWLIRKIPKVSFLVKL